MSTRLADWLFVLFLALAVLLSGCAKAAPDDDDMQRLLGYMVQGCRKGAVVVDRSRGAYEWTCSRGYRDRTLYPYEYWVLDPFGPSDPAVSGHAQGLIR